jgi:hypothetical protein
MFKSYLKFVRAALPHYRFRCHRVKLVRTHGTCRETDKDFLIKINKDDPECTQIETLTHEVAHMLSWPKGNDHNKHWSAAYAESYKLYEAWCDLWNRR